MNAKQRFQQLIDELRPLTTDEKEITLLNDIEDLLSSDDAEVELDFDFDADSDEEEPEVEEERAKECNRDPTKSKFTHEEMVQMKEMNDRGWSFSTIQHRFRRLASRAELNRFIGYAESGGTKYMKFKDIDEFVYRKFCEARSDYDAVHDRDLQEWALIAAHETHIQDFKASDHWLLDFKRKHRISGRKITKLRSKGAGSDARKLQQEITEFQQNLAPIIENTNPADVINSDQLGINLELVEGRTLDQKGVKRVEVFVQRINATTHSLSLQPEIAADGSLMSPLLVVFAEQKEPMRFQAELAEFTNLWCRSTTSGKLTTAIEQEYIEAVVMPRTKRRTEMIIDSWGGYTHAIEEAESTGIINFHIIPKGATGRIQPLDVFFNRQFKDLLRTLCRLIRRRQPNYIVSVRKNLARLLSIVHHQFTAKRFRPMIQYAWFASGYSHERPASFRTPAQYCIFDSPADTRCNGCQKLFFVRCAHC